MQRNINETQTVRTRYSRTTWYGLIACLVVLVGLTQIRWIQQALAQRDTASDRAVQRFQAAVVQQAAGPNGVAWVLSPVIADETTGRLQELSAKLRSMPAGDRPQELMDEYKELLTEQFNQRHQSQVQRLDNLLAEVQKMEAALKRREEQKSDIISRRMLELLGESDPLHWDYQPTAFPELALTGSSTPAVANSASDRFPPSSRTSNSAAQLPGPGNFSPTKAAIPPSLPAPSSPKFPSAPIGGPLNPFQGTLPPVQNEDNDPLAGPGLTLPPAGTAVDASSNEFISIGYRLKGLGEKAKELERHFGMGLTNGSELRDVRNSLEEAQAQWEFKKRELRGQLEAAEMNREFASAKLNRIAANPGNPTETLEAEQEFRIRELMAQHVVEQLEWMKEFEHSLAKEKTNEQLENRM